MTADVARGGEHVLQIGGAVFIGRRADCDEAGLRAYSSRGARSVVNESRPAAALRTTISCKPGSWIGMPPRFEQVDLVLIDVEAADVVADIRETGAVTRPT